MGLLVLDSNLWWTPSSVLLLICPTGKRALKAREAVRHWSMIITCSDIWKSKNNPQRSDDLANSQQTWLQPTTSRENKSKHSEALMKSTNCKLHCSTEHLGVIYIQVQLTSEGKNIQTLNTCRLCSTEEIKKALEMLSGFLDRISVGGLEGSLQNKYRLTSTEQQQRDRGKLLWMALESPTWLLCLLLPQKEERKVLKDWECVQSKGSQLTMR